MTDTEFETYTRSLLNDSPAAMWSGAEFVALKAVAITLVNATGSYKVDGTQVVGNQAVTQAALKADYTTGDLDSEAEIIAAINATNAGFNTLLAKTKTHGLLASA